MSYRSYDTSRYSSRYGSSSASKTPDISISSSLNSYRPGNYRPTPTLPPSSYVAPRVRERSSSRERYTTTYLPKETRTPSEPYPRPSYSRSNSTLSESETPDKISSTSSYRKYGTSPSRTISYTKPEDKSTPITPKTETVALKYTTNPYTSRFLASVGDKNQEENRYTYRTRPQPVLKNLEISIPKSETNSPLSPLSPRSRSPLSSLSPKTPSSPVKLTVKTEDEDDTDLPKNIPCTISVVNRGTSPNPPTSYSRSRRSEIAREIQRDVARPRKKPETRDQETQTDKVEESTRFSRFGTRSTPWSSYLDRFSSSSYTPSVSRYSRYPNEPPRASRNTKTDTAVEPTPTKTASREKLSEKLKNNISNVVTTSKTTPLPTNRNSPPKLEKKTNYISDESRPIEKQKSSLTEKIKSSFVDTSNALSKTNSRERSKILSPVKQKTPSPEKLIVTSTEKIKSPSPEKVKGNYADKNKADSKTSPNRFANSIVDKIRGAITKSPEKIVKSSSKISISKQSSHDKLAKSSSPENVEKSASSIKTEKIIKSKSPDKVNEQLTKPRENEKVKESFSPNRVGEKTLSLDRQESNSSSSEKFPKSKPDSTQHLFKTEKFVKSPSPEKNSKDSFSETRLKSKSPEKVVRASSQDKIRESDSTKINITQSPEPSKLPKMPSKTNLTRRRTSKEETPEPLLTSSVSIKNPSIISATENKSDVEQKENIIPKTEEKTDFINKSDTNIPSTSRNDTNEVHIGDKLMQNTSKTNLVSNKKFCSKNVPSNESPPREMPGRLTPRRSVSRDEPIILEKTNMSTELIVGPMKIEAPKNRVHAPLEMLEATSSNNNNAKDKADNIFVTTGIFSEEGQDESISRPTDASTIPSIERSIKGKPPPSPKLISKSDKIPQHSSKSKNIKPSISQNAIPIIKVANKDFRKSPLNMSTGEMKDVTKIEVAMTKRASSEGNSPLCPHKPLKSLSKISLDESSISESNEEIGKKSGEKANKMSISRSSSQIQSNNSSNANILVNTESSSDLSFKSSSGDLLKNKDVSIPIVVETIQHPGYCTQFIRHSRSLRRDSSSTISSSSDTSSDEESDDDSDESDQFKPQNKEICDKVGTCNVMSNKFPAEASAASTSEDVSSLPLDETIDKISKATIDKPPLPPNARAKDDNKPTSFLMRALAPVTNFLWVNKKQDNSEKSPTNLSVADDISIKRSNTSQSISEIHDHLESLDISNKNDIEGKLGTYTAPEIHDIINSNDNNAAATTSNTQNSKDINTWLNADENIVTNHLKGFSKSSENITAENIERNLSFRSLPGRKSRPVSCEIGWWLKDDENHKPLLDQIETVDNACADPVDRDEQKSPIIFRSPSGEHEFSLNGAGDISEYSNSSEETESSGSEEDISEPKPPTSINFKRVESGERAWWLQSTDNIPEGILRMKSTTSLHKDVRNDQNQSTEEKNYTEQNSDTVRDGIKHELSSVPVSEGSKSVRKFKLRHIESGEKEKAWWMESSENIPAGIQKDPSTPSMSTTTTTEEDQGATRYRIRPQQSGERAWWMQSTENIPDGIKRNESSKSISKSSQSSQSRKLRRIESSDKPWWANSQENFALNEGLKRNESMRAAKPPDGLKRSGSTRSTDFRSRRIRHIESGERAWWMDSTDNVPEGITKLEPDSPPQETEPKLLSQASGDRAWQLKSTDNVPEAQTRLETESPSQEQEPKRRWHNLRPQQSGERPWWLDSNANIPDGITQLTPSTSESESTESESDEEEDEGEIPVCTIVPKFPLELGDRTSPDGLEGHNIRTSGRESPYDNVSWLDAEEKEATLRVKKKMHLFIGSHTNIDDILGAGEAPAEQTPIDVAVKELANKFQVKAETQESEETSDEDENEGDRLRQEIIAAETTPRRRRSRATEELEEPTTVPQEAAGLEPSIGEKLDDVALQLYKDGDYGSYLDLEASLSEQQEEFEDFHLNRKNSIVLRTQLSVRVHTIIEKLLKSEGRELRRALFSLKQIFQEDKDLVHEFVQNDGLACLIKVGSEADQNYQNYILRALGQVMLYVDGMNGVMAHNETVQWLYALISSRFRLVVKTALKLLLVFVEYKESNCMLLIKAIKAEDIAKNQSPWSNVMRLLSDYDTSDTELLVYASSLVNKTLNGIPDQDTYYDQADALEEQGMEGIIQRYMSRQGTDLDLLRQFQIYEAVLHHEDGEEKGTPVKLLDEAIRKTLRNRKSSSSVESPNERRKSRRHASLTSPTKNGLSNGSGPHLICSPIKQQQQQQQQDDDEGSSSSRSSPSPSLVAEMRHLNGGSYADNNKANVGVTPALRRRRERTERQRNFIREQQETAAILRKSSSGDIGVEDEKHNVDAENRQPPSRTPSRQDILMNAVNSELDAKDGGTDERSKLLQLNRENTVKDLTQKLANSMLSPTSEQINRSIGDMTGIISKAMEGLAKSKSKGDLKPTEKIVPEIKKSETEIQWENILENMQRPLTLCDLDFTDLHSDDEMDILAPHFVANGIPPPPPLLNSIPPPPNGSPCVPPPPPSRFSTPPAPPGAFGVNLKHHSQYQTESPATPAEISVKKSKKTLKLFWKEVREDPAILSKLQKLGQNLIWDELSPVSVDTQKLEHLFESRAKDINPKTKQEMNKTKEVIVLDPKRSNAINIGMTKLPPPRAIKTAILKMDSTVMTREGIEKLFAMLPTEEERSRIQEAQVANPDIPLGSAEQFLLTMASITELPARLKLWAFKLDYENIEKEIAEPVMDLKQGMEILKSNRTFRCILGTLLSIGIFLNGNEVKGFQIEYLAKVPEVKDTVHKHSLLHHLCHMVMEKFPESTDLYSEIGAVTRASKVDFDELANNINRLENECKASWDHLKVIAKHDGASVTKNKMSEFLTDCAQRIIVLSIVHRRIMNRFHKFLLWLGTPPHRIQDTKPNEFCRIVSEFALEYRTTRERVLQQLEKKANHRERNKTRGKMITEVGKFRSKETDRADAELRQLLGGDMSETESLHGTWRRQRKDLGGRTAEQTWPKSAQCRLNSLLRDEGMSEHLTDGDDEILESLVKTATKTPVARTTPRERKRTRHADLKRSRTRENCPDEASYSNK